MKNTVVILFLLLCHLPVASKQYVWLHGLEGHKGANTWDIYHQIFTAGQGNIFEYTSANSIPEIAATIYQNNFKFLPKSSPVIVIAHSMGGLVARSLQGISADIKGIITVGTAHGGSTLLLNTVKGQTYDFFSAAINRGAYAVEQSLWSGIFSGFPVTTLAAPIMLPVTTFRINTLQGSLQSLKSVFQAGIGVYALTHQCIKDMQPGSPFLNTLNSKVSTVPIINVYGAEDHWPVVRAMGSLSKVAELKHPDNTDRSYDQEFFNRMYAGLSMINQIQLSHNLVYHSLASPARLMPWIWLTRELVLKARYNWDGLYRYLESDMHADFAVVMGAASYRWQSYCVPTGIDLSQRTCTNKYLPFMLDNDGILPSGDVVLTGAAGKTMVNIRVPGVNHQEMGNHIEIRKLLEGILNFKSHGDVFAK